MSIGFKEWTLICDALGTGTQSIILRKGGIAEGRAGFRFQHEDFLLFPTLFHEQSAKLKVPPETVLPQARADESVEIRYRVKVEWTRDLADLDLVRRLAPFHLWRDEVIEERFYYDEKRAVSLAFVRVLRLSEPFVFPNAPRYGGCRSWVNLPELPGLISCQEVIGEALHQQRERELLAVVGEI